MATNSGAERSGPLCPPRPATAEEQASRARKDAIAEGLELEARLARPLASCDRAPLEHRLAKTYERIPGKGNLARETYARILDEHPGYEETAQVAHRLAELYCYVRLPGTNLDQEKASRYARYAIERCPAGRLEWLAAHMLLGQISLRAGKGADARDHFEAIYSYDETALPGEPTPTSALSKRILVGEGATRGRLREMKAAASTFLVAACRGTSPVETISALDELLGRYPNNPELAALVQAEQKRAAETGPQIVPNDVYEFLGTTSLSDEEPGLR